ncbi:class I SAM-dependent methyltransferase [Dictyobacter formicarum]|uniref:Methyltransferase n=1 Tax=Dictyobacter formicarum TaxID=2778368 RepID=A0ABQ3V8U6_9CHLR|nr:class I SAM-dependent methyltransferase [Dictyobacter formicarum]GHO82550.1 methyltransferase [Dictyobacter formicarum]
MGSPSTDTGLPPIHHPCAMAFYEWLADRGPMQRLMTPLREEVAGLAKGVVLEVGAGSGRTFPYYSPEQVTRVEAVEPDAAMLRSAHERKASARVPISFVQARAEALPFADTTFDSAVATLVFCSVEGPQQAMHELLRVLKPGGRLLLVEHVRSHHPLVAWLQDRLVPFTTQLAGNCHWNRDTERQVRESGFLIRSVRFSRTGILPIIVLHAVRPAVGGEEHG